MRERNRYGIILLLLSLPILAEVEWTDFSPKPEVVEPIVVEEVTTEVAEVIEEENIDDGDRYEKYRTHFEDKELVLMVLGGVEWWNKNCGKLSGTGEYFMNRAIDYHEITDEQLIGSMTFQTGHFAAALYNDCDVFLGQVKSIGLDVMLTKTPQETKLDTIPDSTI